jgi:hypothetical protein
MLYLYIYISGLFIVLICFFTIERFAKFLITETLNSQELLLKIFIWPIILIYGLYLYGVEIFKSAARKRWSSFKNLIY